MNEIEEIQKKIDPILKRHDVIRAGLFGSLVRNELKPPSDIDLLIELPPEKSLLDLVALKLELEDVLERPVDLLEYPMIHPRFRKQILEEEVPVW
jgi:predicted nucleotidyltransferase